MKNSAIALMTLFLISLAGCGGYKKTTDIVENEVSFDTIRHAEIYHLFNDTTKPYCNLQIQFIYPSDYADKQILKSLQSIFVSAYFGSNFAGKSPQNALQAYRDQYIESYRQFEQESEIDSLLTESDGEDPKASFCYYESSHDSILFNKGGILSFSVSFENYMGGAHGSHKLNGFVVDLQTGKLLSDADIFCEDCSDKIAKIIAQKITDQNKLSSPEELENIGYSDLGAMVPNGNFYANDKGITYIYNEYEIAPYVMGRTEVLLPYEEIEMYMNKKCPLLKLND